MRRHSAILCISIAASVALFAAAKAAQAQDKVLKIGGLFAMSGPGSYFGVQDKQGIELAIEQVTRPGSTATGSRSNMRIRHAARSRRRRQPSESLSNTSLTSSSVKSARTRRS